MGKRLDIINAVIGMGKFSTAREITERMIDKGKFEELSEFQRKGKTASVRTIIYACCAKGIMVKVSVPAVATYFGSSKWVDKGKILPEYLPDIPNELVDFLQVVPVIKK